MHKTSQHTYRAAAAAIRKTAVLLARAPELDSLPTIAVLRISACALSDSPQVFLISRGYITVHGTLSGQHASPATTVLRPVELEGHYQLPHRGIRPRVSTKGYSRYCLSGCLSDSLDVVAEPNSPCWTNSLCIRYRSADQTKLNVFYADFIHFP